MLWRKRAALIKSKQTNKVVVKTRMMFGYLHVLNEKTGKWERQN